MGIATRLRKKMGSFFSEIFTTYKGLIILAYILLCLFLCWQFADKELLRNPTNYFAFELLPSVLWHVACLFGAFIILCFLVFALGTCQFEKLEIKKNLPKARLPRHEAVENPTLILFIPHRRKGYIEMEFISRGMTKDRWEEKRGEVQSALRRYTIIGEIQDGNEGDWHIVAFHARKGAAKAKRGVLYDDEL